MTFNWLSDLSPCFAAQESWRDGSYHEDSVFHLVYEPEGSFSIACGASLLAEHIRRWRFSPEIIQKLGQVADANGRCVFDESFLNFLQRLRLNINAMLPPEGMLLLSGEPLAILRGPLAQIQLLESALRLLVWQSTHYATSAAQKRWEKHAWKEENTPPHPEYDFSPEGWKIRALHIGGASGKEIPAFLEMPERIPNPSEGLQLIWQNSKGRLRGDKPMAQIRRLYKAAQAIGDVWLTPDQDRRASISKHQADFVDFRSGEHKSLKITRFQNIYQPVLAKGSAVLTSTRKGYLRQRALHQMEAFHACDLEKYPLGWLDSE